MLDSLNSTVCRSLGVVDGCLVIGALSVALDAPGATGPL